METRLKQLVTTKSYDELSSQEYSYVKDFVDDAAGYAVLASLAKNASILAIPQTNANRKAELDKLFEQQFTSKHQSTGGKIVKMISKPWIFGAAACGAAIFFITLFNNDSVHLAKHVSKIENKEISSQDKSSIKELGKENYKKQTNKEINKETSVPNKNNTEIKATLNVNKTNASFQMKSPKTRNESLNLVYSKSEENRKDEIAVADDETVGYRAGISTKSEEARELPASEAVKESATLKLSSADSIDKSTTDNSKSKKDIKIIGSKTYRMVRVSQNDGIYFQEIRY